MELSDLGKLPIPGDKPAGRDIRSEDIYEELVTEINKRGTLNAVGPTNWGNVVSLSQDILQNYSKDILVCSYLCVGLLNTNGLKGLANGVHVYLDLLETYWEGLYPPRVGGRVNAIEWWLNTVNDQLRKSPAEIWSVDELAILKQDFDRLLAFFEQRTMDEPTEIRSVIAKSISLISTANKIVTEQSSTSTASSIVQSTTAGGNNAAPHSTSNLAPGMIGTVEAINLPDIITAGDLDVILRPIFSALSKVSECLHREQPLSSVLFKTNRFVAWVNVTMVPPRDSESTTLLPPPDFQLISTLQQLYQDKNWLELLKTAEARIVEFRFWLDLSYYSYTALNHLNQSAVAQELAYETLSYKNRLKGLEKLCFSDGTPFANDDTQAWIGSIGQSGASSNLTSVITNNTSKQNDDFAQDLADVKELVENGNLPDAINKLHDKIKSATTKRERFIRVMYFCKFFATTQNKYLAKPYLYELLASCKSYQLDSWDPELASEAYQIILDFSNYKDLGLDAEYVSEVLSRLMLVNPVSSLKFHP